MGKRKTNLADIGSLAILGGSVFLTKTARAQDMPWEAPLQSLQDSLTGPVARVFIMVAIVASGVGLAFGEGGNFWRKVCFVVFGASIVFGAASLVGTFGG
jgi:type IV secretory pathway VirB2 component (pilin)